VGLDLTIAAEVVAESVAAGAAIAVLTERRPDGRPVGVMTIEVVPARLIIDRDGALAQLATRCAPTAVAYAVTLAAGAEGARADIVRGDRPELPYRSWLALAPRAVGGSGAVIVTLETAAPDWAAATEMLASLRVFGRDADAHAVTEAAGESSLLPLVKP
jgi:hypothetical protein